MNPLAARIVEDLKAFSADLLDRGLGEGDRATNAREATGAEGTQSSILTAVGGLTMLAPRLIAELEHRHASEDLQVVSTRRPTRARLSRRPSDYRRLGERLIPGRWESLIPSGRLDTRPLRWVLHLIGLQSERLAETTERVAKNVADARASRQGQSVWAEADARTLELLLDRLQRARLALERTEQSVRRAAAERITSSEARPDPYPASNAWTSLRRLAARIENPEDFLPEHLQALWGSASEQASLSHLYERWVGVRLIGVLGQLGWTPRADPVGSIFLGGHIPLSNGAAHIDLWVQPRLTKTARHPSGFVSSRGEEVSPDYLFVTPGPSGPSAFILDATLRTSEDGQRDKARYLRLVQSAHFVRVAGAPAIRSPDLAWAAAPIFSAHNKIFDQHGTSGVVPMHPLAWNEQGLAQWLHWVLRHALVWAKETLPAPVLSRKPPRATVSGPLSVKAQWPKK